MRYIKLAVYMALISNCVNANTDTGLANDALTVKSRDELETYL